MDTFSRHFLIEFWGCETGLDDPEMVREAITQAVAKIDATLIDLKVHQYSPRGVTGLAMLAESHFSVHTWPEHDYLAADIFTCGRLTEPQRAVPILEKYFRPQQVESKTVLRGQRPEADEFETVNLKPTSSILQRSEELL